MSHLTDNLMKIMIGLFVEEMVKIEMMMVKGFFFVGFFVFFKV